MPFDIHVDTSPSVIDPDFSKLVTPNRPAVATPTSGPNRHTTFVPSETTTFSLGEKCPERINDVGITGRTDNHVHFHVQDCNKTVISLGSGATEVTIDAHDKKVPKESTGYSMVTDENAWHDSKLQHFIVSRTEDVVVRAPAEDKTILLQADKGNITAGAAKTVTIGAQKQVKIVADPGAHLEAPSYEKGPKGKVKESFDLSDEKMTTKVASWIQSAYGLFGSLFVINGKDPDWRNPEWKPKTALDVIKALYDGNKLASSIYGYITHSDEGPGKVSITASKSVSVSTPGSVSLFGVGSTSMVSEGGVSMMGLTASAKALLWTSVWGGISTSVKGGKDASLEGEWGEAKVRGRKDVSVSSTTGKVVIKADTDAGVDAKGGSMLLHGGKDAFFGSGKAGGYAVYAKPDSLFLGKATAGFGKDESPAMDEKIFASIDDKAITLRQDSGKMVIRPQDVKINAKNSVWMKLEKAGKVTIKTNGKVLLGG